MLFNIQTGLSRTSNGGGVSITDPQTAWCDPEGIILTVYAAVVLRLAGLSRKIFRRAKRASMTLHCRRDRHITAALFSCRRPVWAAGSLVTADGNSTRSTRS